MYADNKIVLQLISLLKQFAIHRIVVSPGCRHIPFVHSLEQDSFFDIYTVVDERSAAFFAIGMIQQSGEPVAVTCTSGTACQNYGSALVEAYYQHLPLLAICGDRIDATLNQLEDLQYNQVDSFRHCTKYQIKLPEVHNETDEWYCNRLINEALIELTHHGCGPVHINFPILDNWNVVFNQPIIPLARKITLHENTLENDEWKNMTLRLKGKKIAIVWGQSVNITPRLAEAVNTFCSIYDAVILTDNIANCHLPASIQNSWMVLNAMNESEKEQLRPDILISLGGTYFFVNCMKGYIIGSRCQHWQVGPMTAVCDTFHCLSDIFEMAEESFFEQIVDNGDYCIDGNYASCWKYISESIRLEETEYNENYAIRKLLTSLPENVDVQLANSLTLRFANFYVFPPSVKVHCNRGLSGIDGSLSTAVGYAAASNRQLFYITGDLSFFYDMNALSIRHLPNTMRIMLINNSGGGCLLQNKSWLTEMKNFPVHCAAGHTVEAKRWAESCGFKYISARTKEDVDSGVAELLNDDNKQPVFLEVMTEMHDDYNGMNNVLWKEINKRKLPQPRSSILTRVKKEMKESVKHLLSKEKIAAVKILLRG